MYMSILYIWRFAKIQLSLSGHQDRNVLFFHRDLILIGFWGTFSRRINQQKSFFGWENRKNQNIRQRYTKCQTTYCICTKMIILMMVFPKPFEERQTLTKIGSRWKINTLLSWRPPNTFAGKGFFGNCHMCFFTIRLLKHKVFNN